MRVACLLASSFLVGCVGMQRYGDKHPVGETLPTACVSVTSFAEQLRSGPRMHGPDAYIGTYDYGLGWTSGPTFLVAPVAFEPDTPVGAVLQSGAPRRQKFCLQAQVRSGRLAEGEVFEAGVPEIKHVVNASMTEIDAQAVLVRGSIRAACGKHYLVAVQGNAISLDDKDEWSRLRKEYDRFVANLQWPASSE